MYLRLRKRRKAAEGTNTDNALNTSPASVAQPAQPSSSDWVEPDAATNDAADGTDVSSSKHPERGNAHESARGSHR